MVQYAGYIIPVFAMKRWLFWIVSTFELFRRFHQTLKCLDSTISTQLHMVRTTSFPHFLELTLFPLIRILWRHGERIYAYFGAPCSQGAQSV